MLEEEQKDSRVSAAHFVSRVIEKTLAPAMEREGSGQPFETGYGMWAKYGSAPSAEEIDENRREMFRKFADDLRSGRRPRPG